MLRVRSVDTTSTLKVVLKRQGLETPPPTLGSARYKLTLKELGLPPVAPTRLVLEK